MRGRPQQAIETFLRASRALPLVGDETLVDGVGDASFQRSQCFFLGFAFGSFLVVVEPARGGGVAADGSSSSSTSARRGEVSGVADGLRMELSIVLVHEDDQAVRVFEADAPPVRLVENCSCRLHPAVRGGFQNFLE